MEDIFVWDGKGSMNTLASHAHVHSPDGTCLKNRAGDQCRQRELPIQGTHIAHVQHWQADSSLGQSSEASFVRDIKDANIVTSLVLFNWTRPKAERKHKVALDIDIPAKLIPSSTPGNSHLYIDIEVDEPIYWELLDVMDRAGILQPGYVSASKSRGFTALRLPWIKKGDDTKEFEEDEKAHESFQV